MFEILELEYLYYVYYKKLLIELLCVKMIIFYNWVKICMIYCFFCIKFFIMIIF